MKTGIVLEGGALRTIFSSGVCDALLERDAARGGVHTDGTYRTRRLLYVDKTDYGGRPMSGKILNLDGRE